MLAEAVEARQDLLADVVGYDDDAEVDLVRLGRAVTLHCGEA